MFCCIVLWNRLPRFVVESGALLAFTSLVAFGLFHFEC